MPAVPRFDIRPFELPAGWHNAEGGGLWRSLVARFVWDEDVAGSNPVSPTLVERLTGRRKASGFVWPPELREMPAPYRALLPTKRGRWPSPAPQRALLPTKRGRWPSPAHDLVWSASSHARRSSSGLWSVAGMGAGRPK